MNRIPNKIMYTILRRDALKKDEVPVDKCEYFINKITWKSEATWEL